MSSRDVIIRVLFCCRIHEASVKIALAVHVHFKNFLGVTKKFTLCISLATYSSVKKCINFFSTYHRLFVLQSQWCHMPHPFLVWFESEIHQVISVD